MRKNECTVELIKTDVGAYGTAYDIQITNDAGTVKIQLSEYEFKQAMERLDFTGHPRTEDARSKREIYTK